MIATLCAWHPVEMSLYVSSLLTASRSSHLSHTEAAQRSASALPQPELMTYMRKENLKKIKRGLTPSRKKGGKYKPPVHCYGDRAETGLPEKRGGINQR